MPHLHYSPRHEHGDKPPRTTSRLINHTSMDFHNLGTHCAADMCGRQDFLPFTCDACTKVFCLDHRTYAGHSCTNANFNDKRVLECPKCNKVLQRPPGVEHGLLLERHVTSGCLDGVRRARPNKIGCSVKGCRGSEFVKVSCGSCRKNFCFKHRHEEDHNCQAAAEVSKREHVHLQKRSVGGVGGPKPARDTKPSGTAAGDPAARGVDGSRPCGTEAGEAAARREQKARAGRGVATGSVITAR